MQFTLSCNSCICEVSLLSVSKCFLFHTQLILLEVELALFEILHIRYGRPPIPNRWAYVCCWSSLMQVLRDSTMYLWEDRTRQGCQGPHSRECAGYLPPTSWKKKVKRKRMKRKMGEKMDSKEQKGESPGEWKRRWERRWTAKNRRESRREYQDNHIMSTWRWDEKKCATLTKLEPMSMWD